MKYITVAKPLAHGLVDHLEWNVEEASDKVELNGPENTIATFHPLWSNGSAAIRSSRAINRFSSKCYWEVTIKDRLFGTSMMIGVSTRRARRQCDTFVNLLGEDDQGWGLSHKGLLWHNNKYRSFTQAFKENCTTTVGCLYDGLVGTLTFFKDGVNLGIGFTNLHIVEDDLYPCVASTAAKTQFELSAFRREFSNLKERCRSVIRTHLYDDAQIENLQVPKRLIPFLKMEDEQIDTELIPEEPEVKRPKPGFVSFPVSGYSSFSSASSVLYSSYYSNSSSSSSSSSSASSSSSNSSMSSSSSYSLSSRPSSSLSYSSWSIPSRPQSPTTVYIKAPNTRASHRSHRFPKTEF